MKIRRTKADALFSEYVRKRDKFCQRCHRSSDSLQCAHIFSRRHWATRHDPQNAIALCFSCHQFCTENPIDFTHWIIRRIGREQLDRLSTRAHVVTKKSKVDEKLRVIELSALLKTLE